jgi:ribonucleoside-triphosphate reductase
MPRLGYLARDEADFFERLDRTMGLAKKSLEMKRKVVSGNMAKGLLPYSRVYLGTLDNHFSTIGLIGMNEACRNFLGVDIAEPEGKKFAVKTLKHMLGRLGEFQKDTGNLYNLEATPAEGASYRLARLDKRKYPKIITAGKREPYYTNSTLLPANKTDDVVWAMRHQEDLQTLYTGGTVFHVLLAERMADGEACAKFVRKVFENTRLPYITITPSYSICQKHGYIVGEHFRCPTCGKPAEVYSRIVGYYRPVQNWNPGKVEEFRQRKYYDEHKALEKDF